MKIDEPKTPYEFESQERKEELSQLKQQKIKKHNFDLNQEFT